MISAAAISHRRGYELEKKAVADSTAKLENYTIFFRRHTRKTRWLFFRALYLQYQGVIELETTSWAFQLKTARDNNGPWKGKQFKVHSCSSATAKPTVNPFKRKHIPKLKVNSDFQIFIQISNQKLSDIFITTIHTYWCVSHADHFTRLLQTETEPLRNKQNFIEKFYPKSAIFILLYLLWY